MPRTRPPYAPEYRRRIIELARSGRPIAQLAREFEASANAIRKWVKQAGLDEGLRSDGLTTAEREELYRGPGVAATVKPRRYIAGYWSIERLNPTSIIPKGTPVDYEAPHDRARFTA